jgi:hypothetical protein
MLDARVPQISAATLAPIFERLQTSGGELAIGFIRERSDAALLRLYIPTPPEPPLTRSLPKNIFAAASARKREDEERRRYEALRRAWRAEASARVNAFASAVAPLLARQPDALRTDIRSALVRADLFLAEPTACGRTAKNLVILVTDGIDNVNASDPPRMKAPADVLLVNGAGTVAYLAPLHPVRFESLEAALRFAFTEGGARVRQ